MCQRHLATNARSPSRKSIGDLSRREKNKKQNLFSAVTSVSVFVSRSRITDGTKREVPLLFSCYITKICTNLRLKIQNNCLVIRPVLVKSADCLVYTSACAWYETSMGEWNDIQIVLVNTEKMCNQWHSFVIIVFNYL